MTARLPPQLHPHLTTPTPLPHGVLCLSPASLIPTSPLLSSLSLSTRSLSTFYTEPLRVATDERTAGRHEHTNTSTASLTTTPKNATPLSSLIVTTTTTTAAATTSVKCHHSRHRTTATALNSTTQREHETGRKTTPHLLRHRPIGKASIPVLKRDNARSEQNRAAPGALFCITPKFVVARCRWRSYHVSTTTTPVRTRGATERARGDEVCAVPVLAQSSGHQRRRRRLRSPPRLRQLQVRTSCRATSITITATTATTTTAAATSRSNNHCHRHHRTTATAFNRTAQRRHETGTKTAPPHTVHERRPDRSAVQRAAPPPTSPPTRHEGTRKRGR